MLLKDCATIKGGKRLPKGQTLQEERNFHPYIRVKDMQKRYVSLSDGFEYVPENIFPSISRYTVNTDDIILSIVGTVGLVAIVDKSLNNANLTENCVKLFNIKNFLSKYIYYYLISESGQAQIQKGIVGSTQPKFPLYNIEKIEIPDISISKQQHIVDILGSIDDKIENNEKIIKETNEYISKLFLKEAANCRVFKRLDELCSTITKGTTPTTLKKAFVEVGIPFIKVESLNDNHQIDTQKIAFIDDETHALLGRSQLKYKDFLLSIAGTIGRFALLPQNLPAANTNQAVALIRGELISQEYLYALFLSNLCKEQIDAKTVQAVQANLSLSVIGSLNVPYIDDEDFNKEIKSLYLYIENKQQEILVLDELKTLYLQKFFG